MVLILALDTVSFPQESRSRIKSVFHKFFKHSTIPSVKSKMYANGNMFGVING